MEKERVNGMGERMVILPPPFNEWHATQGSRNLHMMLKTKAKAAGVC